MTNFIIVLQLILIGLQFVLLMFKPEIHNSAILAFNLSIAVGVLAILNILLRRD